MRSKCFLALFLLIPCLVCWADDREQAVIAKFAGEQITYAELARREPAMASWVGLGVGQEQIKDSLDTMIFASLLAKEARSSGFADEPDVKLQIENMLATLYYKKRFPKEKIEITDSDVEKYYRKNLAEYKSTEQMRIAQILLADREQADEVRAASKGGADFALLAKQHSLDKVSAKRGGELGLFSPNQIQIELRRAARELDVGEVSRPVRTTFGYHIVKLLEKPRITYRPLEDVKSDIYGKLLKERERDNAARVRKDLWRKYDVEIEEKAIAQIVQQRTDENAEVVKASQTLPRLQPGDPTELQVISETLELGNIKAEKLTETILLGNSTDKPLSVFRVGSTCKCIEAEADPKLIEPGKTAALTFTYDPNMFREQGHVEKQLFIESSDALQSRKFIRLTAELPARS